MTAAYNHRTLIFMAVCGICFFTLGLVLVKRDSMIELMKQRTKKHFTLASDRQGYKIWLTPVHLFFKCYLFHVNNPEDVLKGEAPILTERGPFVYTETLERVVLSVDEEADEILYMAKHTFAFSKKESGNVTENDEVTILNPAYLGTINMLASLSADLLQQYGNSIAKLFPPSSVVFVSGKAGDILFHGMKFTCNSRRFKDLAMICSTLESSKPPIIIDGPRPGTFLYSFFQKWNNTLRGPYRVKRGVQNPTEIGVITEYHGKHIQKIWNSAECNTVHGSDSITWAPMPSNMLNVVSIFSGDLCRNLDLYYQRNISINGMLGYLYILTDKTWEPDEIDCYCPLVDKKKVCLPKGILDIGECQGIPILLSEPHFLHGDPALLQFAQGLKPEDSMYVHQSYVVIEPFTGAPISGKKRTQLNIKLTRHPVDALANVSEGYFPLVWSDEGTTVAISAIPDTFQILRLLYVTWFIQFVPLILGAHLLLITLYSYGIPKRTTQVNGIVVESLVVSPGSFVNTITQGPPRRRRGLFE